MKARVSLNLPNSLKTAAEEFAVKEGVSLNQFIALALAEKVGAKGAEAFFAARGQGGDAERAAVWLEGRGQWGGQSPGPIARCRKAEGKGAHPKAGPDKTANRKAHHCSVAPFPARILARNLLMRLDRVADVFAEPNAMT